MRNHPQNLRMEGRRAQPAEEDQEDGSKKKQKKKEENQPIQDEAKGGGEEAKGREATGEGKGARKKGFKAEKADEGEGEGQGEKVVACFARRKCPSTTSGKAKWQALRDTFNDKVKPHLTAYSEHEDSKSFDVFHVPPLLDPNPNKYASFFGIDIYESVDLCVQSCRL